MRIHFSNVNFSSSSGPNSFAGRLAHALAGRGHQIVNARDPYDVFLAFIEPSSEPREGARYIQRLDGIWFKPEQFHTHNRRIRKTYDRCDHVVFQSQFDKEMIEHHWDSRPSSVIHNGIGMVEHAPANIMSKVGRVFVCSSNWHPQKRLSENVRLFQLIRQEGDILFVLGSHPDVSLDPARGEHYVGSVSHADCLSIFRRADWMIHLAWLDHCPNVVVEAMSQGTPVICAASGGTRELVGDEGVVIPEVREYRFELTDYDDPPPVDLTRFVLPAPPVVNPSRFDIQRVVDRYEKVFLGDQ